MSTADIAKALADAGEAALAEKVLKTEVELSLSMGEFSDAQRRGELTALYGLTLKQRRVIMETIVASGAGRGSYEAQLNARIVQELNIFEKLEQMSPERELEVRREHFYRDYTTLEGIAPWSNHQVGYDETNRMTVTIKGRWGDVTEERLADTDVAPKAEPCDEIAGKVSLFHGNICALEVDAVVNAANESLRGGGGIDGAIHNQSGPLLDEECIGLCGCATGSSKITLGYRMPSKYIIHTVGPIGEKPDELRGCYESALQIVKERGLRSVAFCCISTGIFGYPLVRASHIAMDVARRWLEDEGNRAAVDRIVFCLFLPHELEVYERLMPAYFPRA